MAGSSSDLNPPSLPLARRQKACDTLNNLFNTGIEPKSYLLHFFGMEEEAETEEEIGKGTS